MRLLIFLLTVLFVSALPEQIHLAFADDDDSFNGKGMAISWATSVPSHSHVNFGLTPSLGSVAEGYSLYYLDRFHGGMEHHHVVLKNLTANTVYYYQVGDVETNSLSDIYSFLTAPQNMNSTKYPFSFLTFADMGIYNSNTTFAALRTYMQSSEADTLQFVLFNGDIAYADDAFLHHPSSFKYEYTYNVFMNEIQSTLVRNQTNFSSAPFLLPILVSPGNHEAECHSFVCKNAQDLKLSLHNFSAYNSRFRMPSIESGSFSTLPHSPSMWYSLKYGPLWITGIDTETDYTNSFNDSYVNLPNGGFGDQISWVSADLAASKKAREEGIISFSIVSGHRPTYTRDSIDENGRPSGDAKIIQDTFEALFYKNNSTLVCVGHTHATEITYPVFNSTVFSTSYDSPQAPIHYLAASVGNDEGLSKLSGPIPSWSRYSNGNDFGFSVVHVLSEKQMQIEFIANNGLTKLDVMTINL